MGTRGKIRREIMAFFGGNDDLLMGWFWEMRVLG